MRNLLAVSAGIGLLCVLPATASAPYGLNWPGTSTDPQKDVSLHADPIRFTSRVFQDDEGTLHN